MKHWNLWFIRIQFMCVLFYFLTTLCVLFVHIFRSILREKHSIFISNWSIGLLCCQLWINFRFASIDHPATKQTLLYTCAALICTLLFLPVFFFFYLSFSMCASFNHKLKLVNANGYCHNCIIDNFHSLRFDSAESVCLCVCFCVDSRIVHITNI